VTEFAGTLYDGRTASAVPVRVIATAERILVDDGCATRSIARTDVAVDAPLSGVARSLRLPGGELIETVDGDAVAQLWRAPSRIAEIAHALESRWTTAIACLCATAGLAWLVVAVVLPLAADPVARTVSPAVARLMGQQTLAALDKAGLMRPSELDDEQQDAVHAIFDRYVAAEPDTAGYRLELRHAGAPNAFALPGGIIIVTDEMVALVDSDDELRAVLAHEIGHVRGRHALRLVLQDSGIAVLMTALAGDAVGVTVLAAAMPTILLQTHYSRRFENEADDYAFDSLKRHHVPPLVFAALMRRLGEQREGAADGALLRYLSTHPATEERIRRAEAAR